MGARTQHTGAGSATGYKHRIKIMENPLIGYNNVNWIRLTCH